MHRFLLATAAVLALTSLANAQGYYGGTDGSEVLGPHNDNGMYGGWGGDDVIMGGLGWDWLIGGDGRDLLIDTAGGDVFYTVECPEEVDVIYAIDDPELDPVDDVIECDIADIVICDPWDMINVVDCSEEGYVFQGYGFEYYALVNKQAMLDRFLALEDTWWAEEFTFLYDLLWASLVDVLEEYE